MLLRLGQGPQQLELRIQIPPAHLFPDLVNPKLPLHDCEFAALLEVGVGEFELFKLTQMHEVL